LSMPRMPELLIVKLDTSIVVSTASSCATAGVTAEATEAEASPAPASAAGRAALASADAEAVSEERVSDEAAAAAVPEEVADSAVRVMALSMAEASAMPDEMVVEAVSLLLPKNWPGAPLGGPPAAGGEGGIIMAGAVKGGITWASPLGTSEMPGMMCAQVWKWLPVKTSPGGGMGMAWPACWVGAAERGLAWPW
jgi:hypothetical protein